MKLHTQQTKVCSSCGIEKKLSEYSARQGSCKICRAEKARIGREKNVGVMDKESLKGVFRDVISEVVRENPVRESQVNPGLRGGYRGGVQRRSGDDLIITDPSAPGYMEQFTLDERLETTKQEIGIGVDNKLSALRDEIFTWSQREIKKLRDDLTVSQNEVKKLGVDLEASRGEVKKLEVENRNLRLGLTGVGGVQVEIEKVRSGCSGLKSDVEKLKLDIGKDQAEIIAIKKNQKSMYDSLKGFFKWP